MSAEHRIDERTRRCVVCREEKPAEMVDRTTVETIAPIEGDVCEPCQVVHEYDRRDGACLRCGADIDPGSYLEIEFPVGDADRRGSIATHLCSACAEKIATDVLYRALETDPAAHDRLVELVGVETTRLNELESGSGRPPP